MTTTFDRNDIKDMAQLLMDALDLLSDSDHDKLVDRMSDGVHDVVTDVLNDRFD